MKKIAAVSFVLFAVPLVASAQALQPLKNLVVSLGNLLDMLIPVLIAAALVVFFWGLVQYIRASGSEEGHEKGRNTMIAGLISLFIMVSVWGIIALAQNALGLQGNPPISIPQVPQIQR